MKTIEDMRKEYDQYEPTSELVTNLEEFHAYMEIAIDDADENEKAVQKEINENNRWKINGMIRNFFFFIFEEEDIEFYDEDNNILQEIINLIRKYLEFYKKIKEIGTEDNFQELVKLVDFACEYYGKQIDYYEYRRDQLELSFKGFYMTNPRHQDNKETLLSFIESRISEIEKSAKPKSYIKKGPNHE